MKKLAKRMETSNSNAFHKSACSCLTTCIVGCTPGGPSMSSAERQVRPNQRADGVKYNS